MWWYSAGRHKTEAVDCEMTIKAEGCVCVSHRLAHNVQPRLLLDASSTRVQTEKTKFKLIWKQTTQNKKINTGKKQIFWQLGHQK